MSEWTPIYDGEPPLMLDSAATETADVAQVLVKAIAYMTSRTDDDGSHDRDGLHIYVNATNGYVRLNWVAADDSAAGEWVYTVQLQTLWERSLEHEEGAFFFDGTLRTAAIALSEHEVVDAAGLSVVTFETELGGFDEF